jgi:hypothetical protein
VNASFLRKVVGIPTSSAAALLLLDDVDNNKSMCIVFDAQNIVFKLEKRLRVDDQALNLPSWLKANLKAAG